MKWKMPPVIKIYEALGAVADGRVIINGNEGKVWSSSRNKLYKVSYDSVTNAIMANDNGSYWQGYLGYPAIAFLMVVGVIDYPKKVAEVLKEIAWKDINTRFKNDFVKTEKYILDRVVKLGFNKIMVESEVNTILVNIKRLHLAVLGKKVKPPDGY